MNVSYASSCHFLTFPKLLILNKDITASNYQPSLFLKNSCTKKVTQKILNLFVKSNGTLTQRYINEVIKDHAPRMLNDKVELIQLDTILREQVLLPRNYIITNIKSITKKSIFGIHDNDSISIECQNCKETGNKSFFLKISDKSKTKNTAYMLTAKIKQKIWAMFPKRAINQIGKNLSKNLFYKREIYTIRPQEILSIENGINFFKSTKPLTPDRPLSRYDILPRVLIRSGDSVSVSLKDGDILLQTTATALSNGIINQSIRLKIKKKYINGIVIGINKAEVQL